MLYICNMKSIGNRFLSLFVGIFFMTAVAAQSVSDVILLKDPISGKWGYASKVQNRRSPFRGMKKIGRSILGKDVGSTLIGKSEADEIDWVIPPQYDAASKEFPEQLAAVEVNGKVGYIDIYNRFIIEPNFDAREHLEGFSLGLSAVKIGNKYGFIDKTGHIVIEAIFDYAENFKDNMLATVKQNGKYGAIDITGTLVVPCKSPLEATMISAPILNKEYKAAVKTAKAQKDNLEFLPITQRLDSCTIVAGNLINDTLWVQNLTVEPYGRSNHTGLCDQYGRVIIPEGFDSIVADSALHIYMVRDTIGLYGLYNYNGTRIFRPLFDSMTPFSDNQSEVTVAELTGWIDPKGGLDPDFLDNICNKGLAYDQAGQISEASLLYNRILRIDPNHVMALNNLAIIDIDNKDYNKGMRKLKLAHKLAPDNELIDQNLHQAKKNRNERRWNRVTSGLEIAAALVGAASATYTAINGSQGMTAGGSTSVGSSTSSNRPASGKNNVKVTCVSCKGSGICKFCNGSGYDKNTKSGKCNACHHTGKCKLCRGKGET